MSDDGWLLGCRKGRPTRKSVSRAFGFPAPKPFVELLQTIYDVAGGPEDAENLYEELLGLRSGGAEARYQEITPPELFPIGDTGGDGEHYGYVIHAMELGADNYPMGLIVPGDGDGVLRLGDSTRDAVRNIVALQFGKFGRKMTEGVRKVLSRLRITVDRPRARHWRETVGEAYRRAAPRIPRGYRHVMTSDGIGVLAPAKSFGKEDLVPFEGPTPPSRYLALAKAAIAAKTDGAALFYLKEGRDRSTFDQKADSAALQDYRKLIALLAKHYRRMGRGLLAKHVY